MFSLFIDCSFYYMVYYSVFLFNCFDDVNFSLTFELLKIGDEDFKRRIEELFLYAIIKPLKPKETYHASSL